MLRRVHTILSQGSSSTSYIFRANSTRCYSSLHANNRLSHAGEPHDRHSGCTCFRCRNEGCVPPPRFVNVSSGDMSGGVRRRSIGMVGGNSASNLFNSKGRGGCFSPHVRCYSTHGNSSKDPYTVLGVSRTASAAEIKKAYRKLAMEKHPDQGGKSEEFAEINAAYEVLSDPSKKAQYDQFGTTEGMMGGGAGHPGNADIFGDFFRDFTQGGKNMSQGPPQTEDIMMSVSYTLEDVYLASKKTITFNRPTVCATCQGNGSTNPGAKKTCSRCRGTGQEVITNQVGPGMMQQFVSTCRSCKGTGNTLRPEDACRMCRGEGYALQKASVQVPLHAGVFPGDVLLMPGEAGCLPGGLPGDLHVRAEEAAHATFRRRGYDLITRQKIPLIDALVGYNFTIKHLDGRVLHLVAEATHVVRTDSVLLLRGEGMPKGHSGQRGNLYVVLDILMPTSLTANQKEKLKEVFEYKTKPHVEGSERNTLRPDVVPVLAEDFMKNKEGEWQSAEVNAEGAGSGHSYERIPRAAYDSGAPGRGRRKGSRASAQRQRGNGGGTECRTM